MNIIKIAVNNKDNRKVAIEYGQNKTKYQIILKKEKEKKKIK